VTPVAADPIDAAHRGGWKVRPENTILTFNHTLGLGVSYLEIDIWLSSDGVPVVFHDPTLQRTTDGTGLVYEKTLAELKALDAGSYFDPPFPGERIPTFEETLDTIYNRARLIIEVKNRQYIPTVVAAINDHPFPAEQIISWVRLGTGMADEYKQTLPESRVLLGTSGPGGFEEHDMWLRTVPNPVPDLAVFSAFKLIRYDSRWIDLAHSYGLLVFTGPANMPLIPALESTVDGIVYIDPDFMVANLPRIPQACSDGIDNDGDGHTDFPDDPGCFHAQDDVEDKACSDGIDNDGDGNTDFPDDPGCFSAFYPFEDPACSDNVDNNGDGLVDYPDDPGCFSTFDQREGLACNDGFDNDLDGRVDYPEDTGCASPEDTDELGAPAGAMPDGYSIPGDPLTIDKADFDQIVAMWDNSCAASDVEYALYEGVIGDFESHVPVVCNTGGATIWPFDAGAGNRYYLVVPQTPTSEGSYGVDGSSAERPASTSACGEQVLGPCD